ncbi:MAG TPA: response regulator [Oligoflexia bacterium]|nr:response regulator [Oligoflexia bacterium]
MFDAKTRILVIDDMMTMRKVVAKCLREMGFSDILEAKDGADGWEKITNAAPPVGLVISDWNMPNCMGIDLLKRVRADSRFKLTPFIMVTAESEQSQVKEALLAGVTGYIVKPFTTELLKANLEKAYAKALGK